MLMLVDGMGHGMGLVVLLGFGWLSRRCRVGPGVLGLALGCGCWRRVLASMALQGMAESWLYAS